MNVLGDGLSTRIGQSIIKYRIPGASQPLGHFIWQLTVYPYPDVLRETSALPVNVHSSLDELPEPGPGKNCVPGLLGLPGKGITLPPPDPLPAPVLGGLTGG